MKKLHLQQIFGRYAVCQVGSQSDALGWLDINAVHAIVKDEVETTVVVSQDAIPVGVKADRDWVLFYIQGTFGFGETGVVLSAIKPLSENNIGVFVLSTFSSDLLLIKERDLESAHQFLQDAGHQVTLALRP